MLKLNLQKFHRVTCLHRDRCTFLADLDSLRTPVNSSTSKPSQRVSSTTWFEPETTSSLQNANKFNEGMVCSLYHILFQSSNESSGLVNYLMAIVSRYDQSHLCDSILRRTESLRTLQSCGKIALSKVLHIYD